MCMQWHQAGGLPAQRQRAHPLAQGEGWAWLLRTLIDCAESSMFALKLHFSTYVGQDASLTICLQDKSRGFSLAGMPLLISPASAPVYLTHPHACTVLYPRDAGKYPNTILFSTSMSKYISFPLSGFLFTSYLLVNLLFILQNPNQKFFPFSSFLWTTAVLREEHSLI